jgi:hypothetical protein
MMLIVGVLVLFMVMLVADRLWPSRAFPDSPVRSWVVPAFFSTE